MSIPYTSRYHTQRNQPLASHPNRICFALASFFSYRNINQIIANESLTIDKFIVYLIFLPSTFISNYFQRYPTMSATGTLQPFSDLRKDYQAFRLGLTRSAIRYSTSHPLGLLGFLLPEAAFQARAGAPFVPFAHPGPEPPAPHNAEEDRVWKHWEFKLKQYQTQQAEYNSFLQAVIDLLSPSTQRAMHAPGTDLSDRSLRWILEYLDTTFGTLTPADYEANEALLRETYVEGTSFREFLAHHRKCHHIAATATPLTETSKVSYLRKAVENNQRLARALDLWTLQHTTIASQTFESLATTLENHHDNSPCTATSASVGYTAAAAVTTPDFATLLTMLAPHLPQLAAMAATGGRAPAPAPAAKNKKAATIASPTATAIPTDLVSTLALNVLPKHPATTSQLPRTTHVEVR